MPNQRARATDTRFARRTSLPAVSVLEGAIGSEASEIFRLYSEWLDLKKEGQGTTSDEELDQVVDRMQAIELQIYAIPSRTPRDLAVKISITQDPSAWEEEQPVWQEIRQLVGEV